MLLDAASVSDAATTATLLERFNVLTPKSQPQWGKMTVSQMLAHLNVAYDISYGKIPVRYNWLTKQMLKFFVKSTVVGSKPYKKIVKQLRSLSLPTNGILTTSAPDSKLTSARWKPKAPQLTRGKKAPLLGC